MSPYKCEKCNREYHYKKDYEKHFSNGACERQQTLNKSTKRTITIELDCPLGNPRPYDLLPNVIEGTGLICKDPAHDATSALFGAWIWEFEVDPEDWKRIQPIIRERILKLYIDGRIRGAKITNPD